jgi:hypothetical protein
MTDRGHVPTGDRSQFEFPHDLVVNAVGRHDPDLVNVAHRMVSFEVSERLADARG